MALISDIGRKTVKNRILIFSIYFLLSLMGLTMVVPFMITISGSASNDLDYERFSPLPRCIWSENDRFVKALVPYFNGYRGWQAQFQAYAPAKPESWTNWSSIGRDYKGIEHFANTYKGSPAKPEVSKDYAEFTHSYPLSDCEAYAQNIQTVNFLINEYSEKYRKLHPEETISGSELRAKALDLLGKDWGAPYQAFYNINFDGNMKAPLDFQSWFPDESNRKYQTYMLFKEALAAHEFTPGIKEKWLSYLKEHSSSGEEVFPVGKNAPDNLQRLWLDFKQEYAPASPVIPFALRASWYAYLNSEEVANIYRKKIDIAEYNRLAKSNYASLQKTPFPIPESFPVQLRKLFREFQMKRYPLRLISIKVTSKQEEKFRSFTKKIIPKLTTLNSLLSTNYNTWSQLRLNAKPLPVINSSMLNQRNLWKSFAKSLAVEDKIFTSSEIRYQQYLMNKYGTLENINRIYGWKLKHIEEAFPPFMAAYAVTFKENEGNLISGLVFDNYKVVIDYILFNGNAILVTLILIALTIFFTLTINPLAAYSLSRFNLRGSNQILIFMLATMAFPTMVSAIPAYLLMRDLGMLNTFAALVIPSAANGMSIFILKGFFDSLPMELFEAATIDGASEMQIFRIVAMPLVKPILAINCLTAFIVAYNGWQWALIICQDKSMWTVAVWMYQASFWWGSSPWIVSAGFVLCSIPTLIVFISCQKIILRGIIIPSMK